VFGDRGHERRLVRDELPAAGGPGHGRVLEDLGERGIEIGAIVQGSGKLGEGSGHAGVSLTRGWPKRQSRARRRASIPQ